MKNAICNFIYNSLYKADKVKSYDYETAPYCGHHYNGHNGKYTMSSYHEGMGYCEAKLGWLWVYKNSEENDWRFRFIVFRNPPIVWHKVISKGFIECVYFHGFIGYRHGFINKWFDGWKPFANGKTAWHFLGFRFTKGVIYNGSLGLVNNQLNLLKKYKSN